MPHSGRTGPQEDGADGGVEQVAAQINQHRSRVGLWPPGWRVANDAKAAAAEAALATLGQAPGTCRCSGSCGLGSTGFLAVKVSCSSASWDGFIHL